MFLQKISQYIKSYKDNEIDLSQNDKRVSLLSLSVFAFLSIDSLVTITQLEILIRNRVEGFIDLVQILISIMVLISAVILGTTIYHLKKNHLWSKHLPLIGTIFLAVSTSIALDYDLSWYFLIPSLVSCLYYRPLYTLGISLFMLVMMPIATVSKELIQFASESAENFAYLSSVSLFQGIKYVESIHRFTNDIVLIDMLEMGMEMSICLAVSHRGRLLITEESKNAAQQSRIKRDLEIAEKIQLGLHPVQSMHLPNVEVTASMNAASSIGGDLYDFFQIDDELVCTAIADVSGKGIPAAIFAAAVKTLIHTHAQMYLQPEIIMEKVNAYLCQNNAQKLFVTVWIGILNLKTGLLTFSNAGHTPPCIIRKNQQPAFISMKPNFIVARKKNIQYSQEIIQLEDGDKLFLYTDGVTEANNQNGELFGEKRLLEALDQCVTSTHDNLEILKTKIQSFAGDEPQSDDITMLMLQYTQAKAEV